MKQPQEGGGEQLDMNLAFAEAGFTSVSSNSREINASHAPDALGVQQAPRNSCARGTDVTQPTELTSCVSLVTGIRLTSRWGGKRILPSPYSWPCLSLAESLLGGHDELSQVVVKFPADLLAAASRVTVSTARVVAKAKQSLAPLRRPQVDIPMAEGAREVDDAGFGVIAPEGSPVELWRQRTCHGGRLEEPRHSLVALVKGFICTLCTRSLVPLKPGACKNEVRERAMRVP
eukprot:scaffold2314_cov267-Pinguiococcus_pyrenoidosus.AAC.9